MKKSKKTAKLPNDFDTLKAASDYWDNNSVSGHQDDMKECEFDVEIEKAPKYLAIEKELSKKVAEISRQRGVTPETLINLWISEKISAK